MKYEYKKINIFKIFLITQLIEYLNFHKNKEIDISVRLDNKLSFFKYIKDEILVYHFVHSINNDFFFTYVIKENPLWSLLNSIWKLVYILMSLWFNTNSNLIFLYRFDLCTLKFFFIFLKKIMCLALKKKYVLNFIFFWHKRFFFFIYSKASLTPVKVPSETHQLLRLRLRLQSGSLLQLENWNRLFVRFVACCQEAPGAHHSPGPINLPSSSNWFVELIRGEKWLMFGHGFSSSSFSLLSLSWLFFRSIS